MAVVIWVLLEAFRSMLGQDRRFGVFGKQSLG